MWGHSSAGRAPAWHAGGQRFESAWLHQDFSNSYQLVLKKIDRNRPFILVIKYVPSATTSVTKFAKTIAKYCYRLIGIC